MIQNTPSFIDEKAEVGVRKDIPSELCTFFFSFVLLFVSRVVVDILRQHGNDSVASCFDRSTFRHLATASASVDAWGRLQLCRGNISQGKLKLQGFFFSFFV